jgi:hypothetical protein
MRFSLTLDAWLLIKPKNEKMRISLTLDSWEAQKIGFFWNFISMKMWGNCDGEL